MIETDLRTELLSEATITAIIGNRMYLKKPIDTQTAPYIEYARQSKTREIANENNRFQLFLFSKDMVQLENLATIIINFLENKKTLNGNFYYSISLDSQTDGEAKLEDGFWWSLLNFTFKHTT